MTTTESGPTTTESPPATIARGTRFKHALFWSYVVTTGLYGITAVMTFILAAILGPEDFGLLWMAMVWITFAQILLQHGPTLAVIQQDDITDRHLDAAFWINLLGATVFALLLAAAAPLWAMVNDLPELTAICLALTVIVPVYALNTIPEAMLRRQLRLRGLAMRYLAAGLISGAAAIACALLGMGVWSLVVQQIGLTVINAVLLWSMISWRPRLHRFRQEWRDIRGTSITTLAGAVGSFVQARADVLLMGAFFGPVVVGLFRFALRVPELVTGITARGLQDVALPDLARHSVDKPALAARLGRLVRAGAVLSVPALGVVAAAAAPFVRLIGEDWLDAVAPMRLLCLASAITILTGLIGPALQAAQRPGLPALATWLNAIGMAGAIFAAAELSRGAGTHAQLTTVAWAVVMVQAALLLLLGYLAFGRVLRVSAWPAIRALIPSGLAAGGAVLTGEAMSAVLPDYPSVWWLALTAGAAGAVAGAVLLATDREARRWLMMAWRKARGLGGVIAGTR
ncbi:MAG TPA: oligosaccharide flippase family protein [Natronosporangium sp.]